jgi:hypothetical protein
MSTTPSPDKPAGHGETRLAVAAILTASRFLAVYWSLQAFAFTPSMRLTWRAVIGLGTALLLATLVRISEARARAGTPGFVRISWVLVVAVAGANLLLGWSLPLWLFAVVLVGIAATCRWLLRPSMETHPLVGFAVHAPIRILSIFYALVIFAADFGWEQLVPEGLLLILGVWMADAAHDCATLPRDSASRARWAAAACAVTSMIGGAAMLLVRRIMELGWPYAVAVGVAEVVILGACVRLLSTPAAAPTLVRSASDIYRVALLVGLVAALGITFGVSWIEGEPWYRY